MSRFALFAAVALIATPAFSANYTAKPVAPADGKIIGRDISWACGPTACTGSTEASRPVVLCQDLAKRTGAIGSFTINGRDMGADELAKCNKSAKGGTPAALATAN
nr:hypothetical protein [uncultured Sphingomonas sp.]